MRRSLRETMKVQNGELVVPDWESCCDGPVQLTVFQEWLSRVNGVSRVIKPLAAITLVAVKALSLEGDILSCTLESRTSMYLTIESG